MGLIDIDAAYAVLTDYYHHTTDIQHAALKEALGRVETVDAAPVIRCRDCESYQINFHWCGLHYMEMHPKDFCSYGERKDSDRNG